MPTVNKPEPINSVWAQTTRTGTVERVTLPSGQTADVKRLGMEGLVSAGLLNETDTLTSMIDQKHIRRVRGGKKADTDEINVGSLIKDPKALGKIMLLVDRATPHIVEKPPVKLHLEDLPDGSTRLIPDDERDESVYTDQIGFEDKMFLFNYAIGGSADVDRFLDESSAAVAGVATKPSVRRPTKSVAGTRKR
jgi:hypothetical protein